MNHYALAVLFAAGLAAGWSVNGWRLSAEISDINAKHAEALAAAEQRARVIETGWYAAINEVQRNARAENEELADNANAANAAADGLREQVNRLSRRPAACPSPANGGATAEAVAGVLADMLEELDRMAGAYAEEAGRTRIAGEACQRAYGALADGNAGTSFE